MTTDNGAKLLQIGKILFSTEMKKCQRRCNLGNRQMSQTENPVHIITLQYYEVSDDDIISFPRRKEKSD